MSVKFTSVPTKRLAQSITSAATSFRLSDILGWDGQPLEAADFGTEIYAVFRNATRTQIEIMEIDASTIASTNITINRRGLQFDGNLTTEVTANKYDWTGSDTYVDLGTDTPQMLQWLKEYIDGIAIAGSPDAATATKGITRLSVAPVSATAPIAVGDNDPRVPTQAENDALAGAGATPSGSNKFLTEGDINNTFFPTPQVVVFTSSGTWTKDAGLKYIIVEGVGGGGGADTDDQQPGSGGGYFRKLILAAALGATETVTIGAAGNNSATVPTGGGNTSFGSHATANGGAAESGVGGTATGGDINISGSTGRSGSSGTGGNYEFPGTSMLGLASPNSSTGYGTGGSDGVSATAGIVIVTEYYS